MNDVTGVALVVGASRGLGLLIAKELIERGYTVHGCARDEAELAEAARQCGPAYLPRVCDTRDFDAISAWVDSIGRVDVAMHVAGVIQVGPVDTMTLGHFHEAIDTMLWGPVHLALAVLPAMRSAGRGRLGIVSSVGGKVSVPHLVPYSTAKFGAVGLAEGLSADLAGSGVTVTSATPGLMRTGGHLAARFTGDATADFAWFAPGASLPGVSVSAERAARRIVDGVLRGRPTVELTPLAFVGSRVHGLAPATTVRMMGVVSRLLPDADDRDPDTRAAPSESGASARGRLSSRVVEALSVLGQRAARRTNQDLGETPTDPPARPTD